MANQHFLPVSAWTDAGRDQRAVGRPTCGWLRRFVRHLTRLLSSTTVKT